MYVLDKLWRGEISPTERMSAVYKHNTRSNITSFHHLHKDPAKNLVNSFGSKAVTEVVADGREMWRIFLQTIAKKPTICHIERHFLCCPAQRTKSIQMLNEHHLEQDDRIHTGSTVVSTIQRLHHIVNFIKIYCCVNFSQ